MPFFDRVSNDLTGDGGVYPSSCVDSKRYDAVDLFDRMPNCWTAEASSVLPVPVGPIRAIFSGVNR